MKEGLHIFAGICLLLGFYLVAMAGFQLAYSLWGSMGGMAIIGAAFFAIGCAAARYAARDGGE